MDDSRVKLDKSLEYLKEEVDLVVDCVTIADELVIELQSGSIRGRVVADLALKYVGARQRLAAFFKENPTSE